MKIFFSPTYSGTIYAGLSCDNSCLMDVQYVDAAGLLGFLQMQLGIHHADVSENLRRISYYKALKSWLQEHPDNELNKQFDYAGLDVARLCLDWRDELVLDGWTKDMPAPTDRLKAIQGAEEYFDVVGYPEQLIEVNKRLETSPSNLFDNVEVVVPCDITLFHPLLGSIVNNMVKSGAKVCVMEEAPRGCLSNLDAVRTLLKNKEHRMELTLGEFDGTFGIYEFENEREEEDFFTARRNEEAADVWIKADTKALDNRFSKLGYPTMGSMMAESSPQIVEMFTLGLHMFENPVNIHSVLDWLSMPMHPLNTFFCRKLADAIVGEGGFNNGTCHKIVADYIGGKYDYVKEEAPVLTEAEKKKLADEREKKAHLYLPFMYSTNADKKVDVNTVCQFMNGLRSWAMTTAAWREENDNQNLWVAQLYALGSLIESFLVLLDDVKDEKVSFSTLENWASALGHIQDYPLYSPEVGCQMCISDPGKMAGYADSLVWFDLEGSNAAPLNCSFLLPGEKDAFEGKLNFWKEENENAFREAIMMLPFELTDGRIILTYCNYRNGEKTQAHEIIVRLKNQINEESCKKLLKKPNLYDEEWKPVERIDNWVGPGMSKIEIKNHDKIVLPRRLSATTIDNLIQYPLDYLLDSVLHIVSTGPGQLAEINTIKGNVAHAIIAEICKPDEGKPYRTVEEIEQRFKEGFDEIYSETVKGHGVLLLLPENQLDEKRYRKDLQECIAALIEIIKANGLRVTDCECHLKDYFGFFPKTEDREHDLSGYIDMTLEYANGEPVVFDFKWSKWKGYQKKLKENLSIQLEIYRWLLGRSRGRDVMKVAYFLMPEHRLYSVNDFTGDNCVKVDQENDHNLLDKIKKSVAYRLDQMMNGIIEIGDGRDLTIIDYENDAEEADLIHLESYDKETHDVSRFSNYNHFKGI